MLKFFSKRLGELTVVLVLFQMFLVAFSDQIKNAPANTTNISLLKWDKFTLADGQVRMPIYKKDVTATKVKTESAKSNLTRASDQLTAATHNFPASETFSGYNRDVFNVQVPVAPESQYQAQESYYNSVINDYYPNGTSVSHISIKNIPHVVMNKYDSNALTYFKKPGGGGEISVEANGVQIAVIAASVWYLIMAVLYHSNSIHSDLSYSPCKGPEYHEEVPLWHVRAVANPFTPFYHGDSSLQKEIFNMFSPYNEQSGEDNSIEMPDMSYISSLCSKDAFFYGMNHQHMRAVKMVTDILMRQPNAWAVMSMAKTLRHSPDINPKVWYGALMRASHQRADMAGIIMPGPLDAMPDTFVPGNEIGRRMNFFRSGKYARSHPKHRKCIRVDGSVGRDNGPENILWYFREDVMVNSHHWYWHLTFPLITNTPIDRRGELFYYTHRSMTTRYNIERLCNGMEIVRPMDIYPGAPIEEGFHAHLTDFNAGMPWTDRPPYTPLSDINRQFADDPDSRFVIPLFNWIRSGRRILKSIQAGSFVTGPGRRMKIPHYEGIDILGNTLEAIDLSINPRYYDVDGYHNNGHRVIGYSVDPQYRLRLPPGPMADPATAMRDPIFYRWHTNMNNIFLKYKSTLPPYQPVGGEFPLLWRGVEVEDISVVAKGGRRNKLHTFWGKRKFELSLGLAFNRTVNDDDYNYDDTKDEALNVCATHLDHEEFDYEITVNRKPCAKSASGIVTVRIFLAPRFGLHGHRFTMTEQRPLFVHLDLFTVKVNVGRNIIRRSSLDSTLTIPYKDSLRQLQSNLGNQANPNCGCGWPHHLLLPKGTPQGMLFDLFVMVTNGDEDVVLDKHTNGLPAQCGSAFLYCGIQNRRFPDFRPMGYPFDRDLYKIPQNCRKIAGFSIWSKVCAWLAVGGRVPWYLEDYTRGITNMGFSQVLIQHIPS